VAVKRIDHIAIVVPDIDEAAAFYRDVLGLTLERIEHVAEQEVVVAFFPTGDSEVELLQPTTADSGVARFLEKRGPGIHHLCLEVEDICRTLADLKARGVELINEEPLQGSGGKKMAFIHPRSTYGVLVELYELPRRPRGLDRLALEVRALRAGVSGFWEALRTAPPIEQPNGNGKGITLKAEGDIIPEG